VCPERIDLIHKNYRKLCNLLVDVEEWGQVVIINMLTRYCRTQFANPNAVVSLLYDVHCYLMLCHFRNVTKILKLLTQVELSFNRCLL